MIALDGWIYFTTASSAILITQLTQAKIYMASEGRGREWLSGRVLDFGPRGPGFEYRAVPESYCIFVNIYHH